MTIYNFSAGPSHLHPEVLASTQQALTNFAETGLSLAEVSHRSPEFIAVVAEARALVRELLAVPDSHEICFMGGGASQHFAAAPLNLLRRRAAYINTGVWAQKAINEAQKYGSVIEVASSAATRYDRLPQHYATPTDADYLHFTSNNTIFGTQFHHEPESAIPLVCDASSDIFSRPLDLSRYDLIYAGGQKNLSMAGLSLIIVRRAALGKTKHPIPSMLDYAQHLTAPDGMLSTAPTVPLYSALCTLRWLKREGGVVEMARRAAARSALLYRTLDESPIFCAHVSAPEHRSQMNVPFRLIDSHRHLEEDFLTFATTHGLSGLRGHRLAGAFRASIYNAMPLEGVTALCEVLKAFAALHA